MQSIHHTFFHGFRDIVRAPARALSAKQILVMTIFLCAGLAVYDLVTYLAHLVDGQSLATVFRAYGFFPFETPAFGGGTAWTVYVIGVLLAILTVMLGFFAVAAINIERMRGNRFLTPKEAIRFSLSRFGQIFYSEMSLVLFLGFIVLLFLLVGLLSRIPFVGEWIWAIFFVVPNFIVGLLTVFIVAVMTVSILLLPAVAAAERQGETFAVILETFSTLRPGLVNLMIPTLRKGATT
jgi:hypothetical protein